jgi:hypothetical protein
MYRGAVFSIECNCGWKSKAHFIVEAAGRDADLHMAEKFPRWNTPATLRSALYRLSPPLWRKSRRKLRV